MKEKSRIVKVIDDIKNDSSHALDYLLSNEVEKTLSEEGIRVRKLIAPILRLGFSFTTKYKLVVDSREKLKTTKKGKIFVVNHRQADDMVLSARAIDESGYFVFGNKVLALDSMTNGYGLWAYGMILVDRDNSESRHSCYDKMKYIIEHGGNVIIFPEGYWNLDDNGLADERHLSDGHNSENWLIQDINLGAIRLAKEIGCELVPTVLHYDEIGEKKCYAKRGAPITVAKDNDIFEKKYQVLESMTTMYWDLMDKYSHYSREELEQDGITLREQWQLLKKQLVADCDIDKVGYKLDLQDEKLIGKAKVLNGVTTNEEAFRHLDDLTLSKNNAFLLSKKRMGVKK